MGNEVNINPFGYDSYRDLKKDIGNTKDANGDKFSSSKSEYAQESIFSSEDKEVTKEDFLDRLEEIGLNDDAASAMWEILNIDTSEESLDILDTSEIDNLLQMYGDDINIDIDEDEEIQDLTLQGFLENLGDENEIKTDDKTDTSELLENYTSDKINRDKNEITSYFDTINDAIEKINSNDKDVTPTSTQNDGIIGYTVDMGKNRYVRISIENGQMKDATFYSAKNSEITNLARAEFSENQTIENIMLDKDKSNFAETTGYFDSNGNLTSINYDKNENKTSEISARFENGSLVSVLANSNDSGSADIEFSVDSNGNYSKSYELDNNGERIIEKQEVQTQPQVQTGQETQQTIQTAASTSAPVKNNTDKETQGYKGDKNLTDLRRAEREELEAKAKQEVVENGSAKKDADGNVKYIIYKGKVYNQDGSPSSEYTLYNGRVVTKEQAEKEKSAPNLSDLNREYYEEKNKAKEKNAAQIMADSYGISADSDLGKATAAQGRISTSFVISNNNGTYSFNNGLYDKNGNLIGNTNNKFLPFWFRYNKSSLSNILRLLLFPIIY